MRCAVHAALCLLRGRNRRSGPGTLTLASRSAQESVLHSTPWFRVPYPLQWGVPTFTWSSTLTMLAGAVSALVESVRPGWVQVYTGSVQGVTWGSPGQPHALAAIVQASLCCVQGRALQCSACNAACPLLQSYTASSVPGSPGQKHARLLGAWSAGPWAGWAGACAPSAAGAASIAAGQLRQTLQRSVDMRATAWGRQLGDWYAAARISGAPVPPPAVMSRATTVQVLRRARPAYCCAANTGGLFAGC